MLSCWRAREREGVERVSEVFVSRKFLLYIFFLVFPPMLSQFLVWKQNRYLNITNSYRFIDSLCFELYVNCLHNKELLYKYFYYFSLKKQ